MSRTRRFHERRVRRTSYVRYEDARGPEEERQSKEVPKDLAHEVRTLSLSDYWHTAKEPTKDRGFGWTGTAEFLLENGDYVTVRLDIPGRELYTPATLDITHG